MTQTLNDPVSVTLMYNHFQHKTVPIEIMWGNRHYPVTGVGLHHVYREGRTLKHIFSVISQDKFFKLSFNTEDLTWRLEGIDTG